jgi:carboxyl-terminal processing protease
MFLPQPVVINMSTKFMPGNPGYFRWEPSYKIGNVNHAVYRRKVVILVDERTQSQGEYSAMALQTIPNSVTIGSQTAGADGVISFIPMGGGLAISYSGYGIYYPDRTPTQRVGVRMDISVKKTVKSVMNDEDVILKRALRYLKAKGCD